MTENQTFPVRLDYPDPQPISLDISTIRGAGTRIRRRRRIAAAATTALVALAVSAAVPMLRSSPDSPDPGSGKGPFSQIAGFLAAHPPLREPVVFGTWPAPWTTVGWPASNGTYCYATFRTPAAGTLPQSGCEGIEAALTADSATSNTIGYPLPALAPMEKGQTFHRPDKRDLNPLVGVARGRVARVEVTVYGQTFTAAVTPLTTWDNSEIGIFQVWIATGDRWSPNDIQQAVAYDSQGAVIVRQGPWIPPTKPAG